MLVISLSAAGQWLDEAKLQRPNADARDMFGFSTSVHGDIAVIGAPFESDAGAYAGVAFIYRNDGSGWIQETMLSASNALPGDMFGSAVCVYQDVAVIGANLAPAGNATGSAYVFRYDGTTWIEEAELKASDGVAGDEFGASVSLYDGVVLIGAHAHASTGAAYVFRYESGDWLEEAKLTSSDASTNAQFGYSVSMHGSVAVIGAQADDVAGHSSGSAYIFRYNGKRWEEEARLTASDASAEEAFGCSVSSSGDWVLVGALFGQDGNSSPQFELTGGGSQLSNGFDAEPSHASDLPDRDTRSVSARMYGRPNEIHPRSNTSRNASGAAYLFRHDGAVWKEEAKLSASDSSAVRQFGFSVSLSDDLAIIGTPTAPNTSGVASGAAYMFRNGRTGWVELFKLSPSDGAYGDAFGWSVSIHKDVALVGAVFSDSNAQNTGSAYVFRRPDDR